MPERERIEAILYDLIELLHLQTEELERLVKHVEQVSHRLEQPQQFTVVASGLSALHQRLKRLEQEAAESKERGA